ncbi:hypothetical protein CC1G_08675 [Coprinopsis cinerea okayama7|uniref:C-CAP/cofactor C-like domain-containing protein n=1 Tax=Coprinopsis cinerea (strain Okayama-7 / 130 / ATCC MYA-4618 / FGSC 9003) TaxID=240176 RepID=A8NZE8_COPC7|nr:hypothetical protein CC1G_08675 [Coprinopsis cinerea okayama7\|eukprot:XP_001837662.1 hypothetical protein CC1G_08675 [Coprinopsis cinerea okayama7\
MTTTAPSTWEFSQQFTAEFQASRTDLQSRLAAAQTNSTPQTLQDLSSRLARLSRSLSDATGSLPSYDQKLYETQVKQLEREIEALRTSSTGKPRFSFKRKSPASSSVAAAAVGADLPPPIASHSSILSPPVNDGGSQPTPLDSTSTPSGKNLTLQGHSSRYILLSDLPLSPSSSQTPDLTICDLTNCIVNLLPHFNEGYSNDDTDKSKDSPPLFGAYHIRNLTNCIILLPFSPGSALIHSLTNCVLVLGSHQFRMHNSQHVDVYLDITSNPIIEGCSSIRFAMYPARLNPDLLRRSPLPPFTIQDFSHIRSSPSPNFSLMATKLENEAKPWPLHKLTSNEELDKGLAGLLPQPGAPVE